MKLGDKPLAEMSEEELREAITNLHASREELRAEAIRKKREQTEKGITKAPKEPRAARVKAVDKDMDNMLAFLQGTKENL